MDESISGMADIELSSSQPARLGATDRREDLMPKMRRLTGRRIAALAADGFEKVELTVPMRALQLAGAKVDVISLRHGRIRGVNLHMPATRVGVDKTVGEADPADYDGLLLPGGFINPDLRGSPPRHGDSCKRSPAVTSRLPRSATVRGCSPRRDSSPAGH